MPSNTKHIPLSAREHISSSAHLPPEDQCIYPLSTTDTISPLSQKNNMPSEDQCIYPLSSTTSRDSKTANRPCIFRPPKSKVDVASTDVCIYPLSSTDVQTLDLFEGKHAQQCREFDYEPLVVIINNIFQYSETRIQVPGSKCISEDTLVPPEDILDIINLISFDSKSDVELRETSVQILDVVMEYKWEAKMVLILAAFVTSYGAFCFDKTTVNPMMRRRSSYPTTETLSSNLMRLSNLVKNSLEVCTIILQFIKDRDQQVMEDMEPKVTKVVHSAIYEIIKIGVACSSYMESVNANISHIASATDIKRQEDLLKELLDNRKNVTEVMATIDREAAQNFTPTEYLDVRQFLSKIVTEKKTLSGVIDFQELKGKSTAFLISNVDVKIENFTTLVQTYKKIHEEKKFRIVWIPIVDRTVEWTDAKEKSFSEVASNMPWYCCHPSAVTEAFVTHIEETWQYQKKSSLVVLNEQTKVIATNALSLVETWGHLAFPFSSDMETTISKSWTIRRMVEEWEIDELDLEKDIVCICGGNNLEMTKSFTNIVKSIKCKSIKIRAIYVGTTGPTKNLQNIVNSFEQTKEIKCLSTTHMTSFWSRLATITKSRFVEHDAHTLDEDVVKEQLTTLLGYNKKEVWTTMIYKGSTEILKSTGAQLLECFEGFNGSNRKFQTATELWECIIKKAESYTALAGTASASERVRDLFRGEYKDVTDLLAKLFIKKTAIFKGQAGFEHFMGKPVCFLITKMDIIEKKSTTLAEIHKQIPQVNDLKVIWIPIGDTSVELQSKVEKSFEKVSSAMSLYYCRSSMLTNDFATYIRREWYSETGSTLVVLDKRGKLVSILPMVEQWGASALPWDESEGRPKWVLYIPVSSMRIFAADDRSVGQEWLKRKHSFSEHDGTRDVSFTAVEIKESPWWYVKGDVDISCLSENTRYQLVFEVMFNEKEHFSAWYWPITLVLGGAARSYRKEVLNYHPTGVWFEVSVGEFFVKANEKSLKFEMTHMKIGDEPGFRDLGFIIFKGAGIRKIY